MTGFGAQDSFHQLGKSELIGRIIGDLDDRMFSDSRTWYRGGRDKHQNEGIRGSAVHGDRVGPYSSSKATIAYGIRLRVVKHVLPMLALERTNTEIADQLSISINTVTRQFTNIFVKTKPAPAAVSDGLLLREDGKAQ